MAVAKGLGTNLNFDKIVWLLSFGFNINKSEYQWNACSKTKGVVVVLHTCELHGVDGSALPCPLLSDSHSVEVFTSSFNIP